MSKEINLIKKRGKKLNQPTLITSPALTPFGHPLRKRRG